MSVHGYDEEPGFRASNRQSDEAQVDADAFLRRSVDSGGQEQDPGDPAYANDDLASRFRSDSLSSSWTRDSLGNAQQKGGVMLREIQRHEGEGGHNGGIPFHRQPRVMNPQSRGSWNTGMSSSSSSGESVGAQRPGFRNGSWNPFKWNWRSLFRRGR